MTEETFLTMLSEDGKKNSLGRVDEVIHEVISKPARLEELYLVVLDTNPWTSMRAIDAFEKICRVHPEWIAPYINRIQRELHERSQASIQWHIAEIYRQVDLNNQQKKRAIEWLENLLKYSEVDWIVAGDTMKTLMHFMAKGDYPKEKLRNLLLIQTGHKSKAVAKKANTLLAGLS